MSNLSVLRDRLSATQLAIGLLTVVAGGGASWWTVGIAAIAVGWALWRGSPTPPTRARARLWTVAIVIALGLTIARAILLLEVVEAGVDFALLLVVQRFLEPRRAREHAQLLGLGSLLMVVGAVIDTGINYPVLLAAFLVVSAMALVTNHLLAEGERLGPRVRAQLERAAERSRTRLWGAAASVAASAGVGALVVFAAFPRFGPGMFLRGPMQMDMQSGFSDEVQLGDFGRIKSDTTVVARIVLPPAGPRVARPTWHLRGSSFDRYDEGRWFHSRAAAAGARAGVVPVGAYTALRHDGHTQLRIQRSGVGRGGGTYWPTPVAGFADATEALRGEIILENIGADVLVAPSEVVGIAITSRGRKSGPQLGPTGELRIDRPPGPIQYRFVSRIGEPSASELEALGDPPVADNLAAYLQRSERLSARTHALALELTANATTRRAKVDAILEHLSGFSYTLELTEPEQAWPDPIEAFLFETRTGHCEYFASAMIVLLREVGVPARMVNGFHGAHWNALGEFYAVRQADAHSWVEVNFGPLGWVTFDPTPAAADAMADNAPLWPAWTELLEATRHAYLEYVIDYDLSKQRALFERLTPGRSGSGTTPIPLRLLVLGPVLFLVFRGVMWIRRRARRPRIPHATSLWLDLLRRLQADAHPKRPDESPMRFATRLGDFGHRAAGPLIEFARAYEAARFGPHAADLRALRRAAADVRERLRTR